MGDEVMCDARKSDRFGTVHQCAIGELHTGYHETADGLMFAVNDGDRLRLVRVPWRSAQLTDINATAGIRELVEVTGSNPEETSAYIGGSLIVRVIDGEGNHRERVLFCGEWVVMYDDGTSEVFARDRYTREIRRSVDAAARDELADIPEEIRNRRFEA